MVDLPSPFNWTSLIRKTCKQAADQFIQQTGVIDILIANAGVGGTDKLSSGDASAINKILSINILGVTNTVIPFIPAMKKATIRAHLYHQLCSRDARIGWALEAIPVQKRRFESWVTAGITVFHGIIFPPPLFFLGGLPQK